MQDATAASMPSVQQVEASMLQSAPPAPSVPSFEQVQAEQAAEQLLQAQHQKASGLPPAAGSADTASRSEAAGSVKSAADGAGSTQVSTPDGMQLLRQAQSASCKAGKHWQIWCV